MKEKTEKKKNMGIKKMTNHNMMKKMNMTMKNKVMKKNNDNDNKKKN